MKKVVSILSKLFVFFLMFISLLIIFSIKWALNNFDNLSIDETFFIFWDLLKELKVVK